jgi:hypothetical protein
MERRHPAGKTRRKIPSKKGRKRLPSSLRSRNPKAIALPERKARDYPEEIH